MKRLTITAIAVYALTDWGVVRLTRIVADRPRSRSVTRSTIEETSVSGTQRVTHTTRND